jgi:hypothetical protein
VIIAVVAVRVVQTTFDQVVNMIPVWNSLVATVRAMDVTSLMT